LAHRDPDRASFYSLFRNCPASAWQGIEPFKSRREDVLKILGPPVTAGHNGLMTFKVAGGTASISFVDENFVRTKKLRPEFAGTVLQVILQHESSSDTPESMGLSKQKDFVRDSSRCGDLSKFEGRDGLHVHQRKIANDALHVL
jgi:hypothetical protein